MQTTVTLTCPLPGFEAVQAIYNMMASGEDWDRLYRNEEPERVVTVEGWDYERYPEGPVSEQNPVAWRLWLTRLGMAEAVKRYLSDPN